MCYILPNLRRQLPVISTNSKKYICGLFLEDSIVIFQCLSHIAFLKLLRIHIDLKILESRVFSKTLRFIQLPPSSSMFLLKTLLVSVFRTNCITLTNEAQKSVLSSNHVNIELHVNSMLT